MFCECSNHRQRNAFKKICGMFRRTATIKRGSDALAITESISRILIRERRKIRSAIPSNRNQVFALRNASPACHQQLIRHYQTQTERTKYLFDGFLSRKTDRREHELACFHHFES